MFEGDVLPIINTFNVRRKKHLRWKLAAVVFFLRSNYPSQIGPKDHPNTARNPWSYSYKCRFKAWHPLQTLIQTTGLVGAVPVFHSVTSHGRSKAKNTSASLRCVHNLFLVIFRVVSTTYTGGSHINPRTPDVFGQPLPKSTSPQQMDKQPTSILGHG